MNVINILGERWLHIFTSTQYGLWSYENNTLKAENNIVINPNEIDEKINELTIIYEQVEDKQPYYEALECLRKIKEKLTV
jgi:hypothetical protein